MYFCCPSFLFITLLLSSHAFSDVSKRYIFFFHHLCHFSFVAHYNRPRTGSPSLRVCPPTLIFSLHSQPPQEIISSISLSASIILSLCLCLGVQISWFFSLSISISLCRHAAQEYIRRQLEEEQRQLEILQQQLLQEQALLLVTIALPCVTTAPPSVLCGPPPIPTACTRVAVVQRKLTVRETTVWVTQPASCRFEEKHEAETTNRLSLVLVLNLFYITDCMYGTIMLAGSQRFPQRE